MVLSYKYKCYNINIFKQIAKIRNFECVYTIYILWKNELLILLQSFGNVIIFFLINLKSDNFWHKISLENFYHFLAFMHNLIAHRINKVEILLFRWFLLLKISEWRWLTLVIGYWILFDINCNFDFMKYQL